MINLKNHRVLSDFANFCTIRPHRSNRTFLSEHRLDLVAMVTCWEATEHIGQMNIVDDNRVVTMVKWTEVSAHTETLLCNVTVIIIYSRYN